MGQVAIRSCSSYTPELVYETVKALIDELGGIKELVKRGERVLIKPNLLSAHEPSRCITTHPEVVKAVSRLCKDIGAIVAIGDSPAIDPFQKVVRKTGMEAVSQELNIPLVEFSNPRPAPNGEWRVFKRIEIASQIFDADKVINIPKLKTHSQMLMTLGVKNNFGTVVKQAKAEWHSTAGTSRDLFGNLLIDVYLTINPVLTILDGIWGMEGMGPTNGSPIFTGVLMASKDPVALDLYCLTMLGISWKLYPIYRQAKIRGLVDPRLSSEKVESEISPSLFKKDFKIPKLDSMSVIPKGFEAISRKYLVSKPVIMDSLCKGCERCLSICPQKAIKKQGNRMGIDYDKCIRCYCCQEVCDFDAITFKKGFFLKITEKIF